MSYNNSGIKDTRLETSYALYLSTKELKLSGRKKNGSKGSHRNSKVTPSPVVEREEEEVLEGGVGMVSD